MKKKNKKSRFPSVLLFIKKQPKNASSVRVKYVLRFIFLQLIEKRSIGKRKREIIDIGHLHLTETLIQAVQIMINRANLDIGIVHHMPIDFLKNVIMNTNGVSQDPGRGHLVKT